jgi:hypothetical protein
MISFHEMPLLKRTGNELWRGLCVSVTMLHSRRTYSFELIVVEVASFELQGFFITCSVYTSVCRRNIDSFP